jgi:hypothetical protein
MHSLTHSLLLTHSLTYLLTYLLTMFTGMSSGVAMTKHSGGVAEYRSSEGKCVTLPYRGYIKDTLNDILGTHSLTYLLTHLLTHLLTYSLSRWYPINLHVCWSISIKRIIQTNYIHSCFSTGAHSLTHSLTYSLTHSFVSD